MTDDELRAIDEARWATRADILKLIGEVRRLRGIIALVETRGISMGNGEETRNCPWCGFFVGDFKRKHAPECPAFTESGDVR